MVIHIDNQYISQKRVDLIAYHVLKKCNYKHGKSKSNNTSLLDYKGKLMFTSGIPLDEFKAKYNVK